MNLKAENPVEKRVLEYVLANASPDLMFETWAVSAKKAIANIRWRIYGRCADSSDTMYWQAREA